MMNGDPLVHDNAQRLDMLEQVMQRIDRSTEKIAEAAIAIAKMEETQRHTNDGLARAFEAINKIEMNSNARLAKLEQEMPLLRIVRGAVLTFAGLCMMTLIGFILHSVGLTPEFIPPG
jgi:hypothetical protein